MERSEHINELATSLSLAQGQFKPAQKTGTNPHLGNRYATLDDIIEAVRRPLSEQSLAFVQMLDSDERGPVLTTLLLHQSGQWISARIPIDSLEPNRGTNDMQAFGATLTYLKRYALAAMLGVSSDEDTDGEGAKTSRRTTERKQRPKAQAASDGRPYDPSTLQAIITKGIEDKRARGFAFDGRLDNYRGAMNANLHMCFAGDKHSDQKRHFVLEYLTGNASSTDLDDAEVKTIHRWLGATKDAETGEWQPDPTAVIEAKAVARQAELDSGQQELEL